MSNVNDSKILSLKTQIEAKRKQLDGIKKFTPVTNCSIELENVRHNIQVLNKEQLISLMVKLHAYKTAAESLGVIDDYIISGYKVGEWIADLKSKLDIVSRKDEEAKLKSMEEKLNLLLSNEKKVELELADIEASLK